MECLMTVLNSLINLLLALAWPCQKFMNVIHDSFSDTIFDAAVICLGIYGIRDVINERRK